MDELKRTRRTESVACDRTRKRLAVLSLQDPGGFGATAGPAGVMFHGQECFHQTQSRKHTSARHFSVTEVSCPGGNARDPSPETLQLLQEDLTTFPAQRIPTGPPAWRNCWKEKVTRKHQTPNGSWFISRTRVFGFNLCSP
uniref:Uncharacterized protein n=1 Tax=Nothobranchius furzeri TaxID=105023 RepID=A0A1A8AHN3_NOTFU